MILIFQEILRLFEEIDRSLQQDIHLFTIGGAVLLYQGLNPATKDIDTIVATEEEFRTIAKVLKEIEFKTRKPTVEYTRLELSEIFIREDFRIDLFHHKVCGEFFLSPGMMRRAQRVYQGKHLSLYLCANEDIFMFKTMTEREGDLEDCIALAKRGLRWQEMMDELKYQIKHTGNKVWITWVGERMDLLIEKGLVIPIMEEVDALRFDYYEELERRIEKG